jgi:hypothetical protein
MGENTKLIITRSFLELETPDFVYGLSEQSANVKKVLKKQMYKVLITKAVRIWINPIQIQPI